ncbi:MAG: GNAT family N-acetyltransferase [Clostridiaceae bacterium]|jgi:GNAT superfamily N-acetyltransferase|nr:GNAT family N-acetyltransferase [Clostridiaceae bacterium]
MLIEGAVKNDLDEILVLQKLAYQSEAELCDDYSIPPLTQTMESMEEDFSRMIILKAVEEGKIIGSVRAFEENGVCHIGRLMVDPTRQNKGIGRMLMKHIEACFPDCRRFSLFTGKNSLKNLSFYGRLGYRSVKEEQVNKKLTLVYLDKERDM